MEFQIGNKVITSSLSSILYEIRSRLDNGKLYDIHQQKGQNIRVSCPNPVHKEGLEKHASCDVFADHEDKFTRFGTAHCFACGYTASLDQFVNDCFDESGNFGKEWLLEHCEVAFVSEVAYLPEITFNKVTSVSDCMDESCLSRYEYYHEYMWKRKLSKEIVDLFEVGYDPDLNSLTFPVRDEKGHLRFITRRSVVSHHFRIPEKVDKPVYLLYYALQQKLTSVAVVESQINALYLYSIGIPAVALFGTGTSKQYEILRKSGIRIFNLYFDGDSPGEKGAYRFKKAMPSDILVNTYLLPTGKDVNDLTAQEVYTLKCI